MWRLLTALLLAPAAATTPLRFAYDPQGHPYDVACARDLFGAAGVDVRCFELADPYLALDNGEADVVVVDSTTFGSMVGAGPLPRRPARARGRDRGPGRRRRPGRLHRARHGPVRGLRRAPFDPLAGGHRGQDLRHRASAAPRETKDAARRALPQVYGWSTHFHLDFAQSYLPSFDIAESGGVMRLYTVTLGAGKGCDIPDFKGS